MKNTKANFLYAILSENITKLDLFSIEIMSAVHCLSKPGAPSLLSREGYKQVCLSLQVRHVINLASNVCCLF